MNVTWLRYPSMELNWLPNHVRKGLSKVRVGIANDILWGGYYQHRKAVRCICPYGDIDLKESAAMVLCATSDDLIAGVIAHELRHHWQVESGFSVSPSVYQQKHPETYEQSIVRYFRSYWWEMDALRFQLKHAPDDVSLQWREWLQ